jgi:hypothetical protein
MASIRPREHQDWPARGAVRLLVVLGLVGARLLGLHGLPHRVLAQPRGGPDPARIEREERDRGRVDRPEGEVGTCVGHERHRQQEKKQRRLEEVGELSRRVLEIGLAVDHVAEREEGRLRRDPSDPVREGQRSVPVERGGQGHDGARDRRRRAQKDAAHHRLAERGAVRDLVGEPRHPEPGGEDHERGRRADPEEKAR